MWPRSAFGRVQRGARFWWPPCLSEQQVVASLLQQRRHQKKADVKAIMKISRSSRSAVVLIGSALAIAAGVGAPASAEPTPSPSASPTASPQPTDEGCRPHAVSKDRSAIRFGGQVTVTLTSPATTTTFVLNAMSPDRQTRFGGRSEAPGDDQTIVWNVSPVENTRLVVNHGQLCPEEDLGVVTVTPNVSITARRNAPRDYTFSGRVLPGRGQPVALYRVDEAGRRILTARSTVAPDGTYRFDRRFTGTGRFGFFVVSGAGRTAPGASPVRSTLIY
jgi:hypothetical protein